MKKKGAETPSDDQDVIFLDDLAPREQVKGGGRKYTFGETADSVETPRRKSKVDAEIPPKSKGNT